MFKVSNTSTLLKIFINLTLLDFTVKMKWANQADSEKQFSQVCLKQVGLKISENMHQCICHGIYSKFSCKFLVLDYLCNGLHYFSFPLSFLVFRGGSRTAATSKMERFVIIVNGWKPIIVNG